MAQREVNSKRLHTSVPYDLEFICSLARTRDLTAHAKVTILNGALQPFCIP